MKFKGTGTANPPRRFLCFCECALLAVKNAPPLRARKGAGGDAF